MLIQLAHKSIALRVFASQERAKPYHLAVLATPPATELAATDRTALKQIAAQLAKNMNPLTVQHLAVLSDRAMALHV